MVPDLGFVPLPCQLPFPNAERRAGTFADRIGKLALSLVGGVQVDQRGAGAAMAHPVHQLAETRSLISGKGVPGMPQVVEVNPGQTDPPAPAQVPAVRNQRPRPHRNPPDPRSALRMRGFTNVPGQPDLCASGYSYRQASGRP